MTDFEEFYENRKGLDRLVIIRKCANEHLTVFLIVRTKESCEFRIQVLIDSLDPSQLFLSRVIEGLSQDLLKKLLDYRINTFCGNEKPLFLRSRIRDGDETPLA